MSKGDIAKENFKNGYNCAQSVLKAFEDEKWFKDSGLTIEAAMKIAASFGGGMGRLREVCGAVSGMFMAAGLAHADEKPLSKLKQSHYQMIQDLAAAYKKENGSIVCRELLGLDKKAQTTVGGDPYVSKPEDRTASYYKKRPCADLCKCAADILENYLKEHQE